MAKPNPSSKSKSKTKSGKSAQAKFNPYESWLGIPIGDGIVDHYRLLGLPHFESDVGAIENASDEQMSKVRIHQAGPRGELTQVLLNQLAEAKLCLLNPEKKKKYDEQLQANMAAAEAESLPFDEGLPPEIRVEPPDRGGAQPRPNFDSLPSQPAAQDQLGLPNQPQQNSPPRIVPRGRFPWEYVILFGLMFAGAAVALIVVWIMS